jgi:hypothetical protein
MQIAALWLSVRHIAMVTEFCVVAPDIAGSSVSNLFHVPLLALEILHGC